MAAAVEATMERQQADQNTAMVDKTESGWLETT